MLTENNDLNFVFEFDFWFNVCLHIVFASFALTQMGVYRAVIRYSSAQTFLNIFLALCISTIVAGSAAQFFNFGMPVSVLLIYFCICIGFLTVSRISIKYFLLTQLYNTRSGIAIYGAGETGLQIAKAISISNRYKTVFFIDDDTGLQGSIINGTPVLGFDRAVEMMNEFQVEVVLLALTDSSTGEYQDKIKKLLKVPVEVRTLPKLSELIGKNFVISNLRKVSVEDLLGRGTVPPKAELMSKTNTEKVVLVTGAGGSIGSQLCKEIVLQRPSRLILFEVSEFNLYQVFEELRNIKNSECLKTELVAVLGSVQDNAAVSDTIRQHEVDTIYHAAAYKHVHLVQQNIIEGVKNNVFGTLIVAEAALKFNVESFVLVSSDKAVRPTNYMGASKRLAELICQSISKKSSKTIFSIVRFGNVLGSSGSVIPKFEKQILAGGPVTVTHENVTRYFMTTFEAAQLVIQAGSLAKGGEVFVLEMGNQVKILDLAFDMIRLNGFTPYLIDRDLKPHNGVGVLLVGLLDGEKLYEEKFIGVSATNTLHPKIFYANEYSLSHSELAIVLEKLKTLIYSNDEAGVAAALREGPVNFQH